LVCAFRQKIRKFVNLFSESGNRPAPDTRGNQYAKPKKSKEEGRRQQEQKNEGDEDQRSVGQTVTETNSNGKTARPNFEIRIIAGSSRGHAPRLNETYCVPEASRAILKFHLLA